jgi:integrase
MSIYKPTGSNIWWVSITHPRHPRLRRSTGTDDRQQAQRVHDEIKAQLWSTDAPNSFHWSDAVLAWTTAEQRSESELLSLRKFSRYFSDRALARVTGTDVEAALSFCETAGTYTRYRTMIVAILNVAKKRKWLSEVPDIPTRRDKKKKTPKWITRDQWSKLHDCLPAHLRGPAVVAINTGLRQSNVFGMRWADVDLDRRVITVRAEDIKDNDGLAVPLNDDAVAAIKAQEGVHPEFVFTYRGRPIRKPKAGFYDACVRAGLGSYASRGGSAPPTHGGRGTVPGSDGSTPGEARDDERGVRYYGFTWHGFRHTWATWHAQNGTPLEVIQKLGGWDDLRMVMNYAAHSPGFLAQYASNVALPKQAAAKRTKTPTKKA